MPTVIEKLKEKETGTDAGRTQAYTALVHQLSDGMEPDPRTAERIIAGAGRTADEFEAAVTRLLRRRQLAAKVAQAAGLAAEFQDLNGKLSQREHELDLKMHTRRNEIIYLTKVGKEAERELRSTASPELVAAQQELNARRDELQSQRENVRDLISRNIMIARTRRELQLHYPRDADHYEEEAKIADARANHLRADLVTLDAEMERLTAEAIAISKSMLEP